MSHRRLKVSQTQEIPAWKVSVTKIEKGGEKAQTRSLVGWEYAAPEKGYPYLVYLHNRAVFQTTPIQDVRRADNELIIKTLNSVYSVEYVSLGYFTDDPTE